MTRKLKGGSKGPGKRPGKAPGKAPGKVPTLKELKILEKTLIKEGIIGPKSKKKTTPKLTKKERENVKKIYDEIEKDKIKRSVGKIVNEINIANMIHQMDVEQKLDERLQMTRAEEERRRAEEERRRTEEEMRRIADIENASKMAEIGDMFDDSSSDFDLEAAGPRRTRRKRNRKRTRRKKSLPGNRRRRRNASSRRKRGRR